jgi:hypothetical protein
MEEKAARLDRDALGVGGGHGPWQRRPAEIGGIKPLAFGQFGEMRPGLAAPLASVAKRGADEMHDGGSISHRKPRGVSRGAVVPPAAALAEQPNIRRVQTQVLLGRLKCALRPTRVRGRRRSPDAQRTQRRRRPASQLLQARRSYASGSGSGGRGFDAYSWGAGYGGDVGRTDRACGGKSAGCWGVVVTAFTSSCGCGCAGRRTCTCVCARSPRGRSRAFS